jgi:hypothetical protein
MAVFHGGNPRGVIATVFKPAQRIDQIVRHGPLA